MEETQMLDADQVLDTDQTLCADQALDADQTLDTDRIADTNEETRACSPKELGRRGEEAAAKFLERRGFAIVQRNWSCFAGEVDIIALQDDTLCFVEVKTRSNVQKGFPSEAVDERKRDRYERIAACYLKEHAYEDLRVRFDVIGILVLGRDRAFLRHHVNAFGSM